jgi:hypothetical protein
LVNSIALTASGAALGVRKGVEEAAKFGKAKRREEIYD